MKRLVQLVAALLLFHAFVFSETIDPPPLRVRQVCGQAVAANERVEIRREPLGSPLAVVTTDGNGKFMFSNISAGKVYLVVPGLGLHWYPLEVVKPSAVTTCKRPLYVTLMVSGFESGIIVSFKREQGK